jgi:hypothetical protein
MYPNNPINPVPTDYLDQISNDSGKKSNIITSKPILVGIIAIVVLMLIIGISSMFSGGAKPSERLAAKLTITSETVDAATSNIKASKLRALNSDLKLYLTNTIRDIEPILLKNNVKISKLDAKVLATESNAELLLRLEDARLNVIYDRTYAREISYQLDTILTLMRQTKKNASSDSLKTFLDGAITNLEPIQQDFSDYNQSTS